MRRAVISLVLLAAALCFVPRVDSATSVVDKSPTPTTALDDAQSGSAASAAAVNDESANEAVEETAHEGEEAERAEETGPARCRKLKEDRHKGDDAVTIGSNRKIHADEVVRGDAVVVGGNLTIEGAIAGDAVCVGGRVKLGPEATVCGDLVTVGGLSDIDPQAYVGGQKVVVGGFNLGPLRLLRHWGEHRGDNAIEKFGKRLLDLISEVITLLFLLFVGFLMTVFMPRQMDRIEEHLVNDFPRSALLGVAMMVLTPVVALVLVFTCVGIPFLPLLGLAVIVTGILGCIVFGRVLGRRLMGERHEMIQILIGLLLIQGASILGCLIALPGSALSTIGSVFDMLGTIIFFGAAMIGLGAVVYSRWGGRTLAESQAARMRNGSTASTTTS